MRTKPRLAAAARRNRRPLLPVLLAVAAFAAILWFAWGRLRRPAELPAPKPVATIAGAAVVGRPVIFLGLDGADWELLDAYASSGAMPALAGLLAEGRAGVLTSFEPPLSPLLWTTMMTGVSPIEHGILDFTRFDPASGAREPIGSEDRRVPALWNMATAAGKSVAVFGLWATWPAEPVRGLLVSDRLVSAATTAAPPPGAVYPPAREAWARETLAGVERGLDRAALTTYLPWLGEADFQAALAEPEPLAQPVSGLRRILLETRAVHRMAMDWLAKEDTDLAVVYFQGTDLVGHLFAPFAPPRQASVREEDFVRFQAVPELYFREIDRYLAEYRDLAREKGAVLVIASDHGFQWREGRPRALQSTAAATAGKWHRREGVSLVWGPGIEPGPREEAGVERLCATLAALAGLPPGAGLYGPPLPGVEPTGAAEVDYRLAWRPAERPAPRGATELDEAALARLQALGYIGAGETTPAAASAAADASRTPGSFNNEGLVLRGRREPERAEQAFERALALDPAYASAMWNLSDLLFSAGRDRERADSLLLAAVTAGLPQGAEHVVGRARGWRALGAGERGTALLDQALAAQPNDPVLRLWRGRYRLELPDCPGALADFVQVAALAPDDPMTQASLGLARACLGDAAGAKAALVRSLLLDPDQPEVREFLGSIGDSP